MLERSDQDIALKKTPQTKYAKLPLGVNIFSPSGMDGKQKQVISHHFAPSLHRDDKGDKLSVIQSLGELENLETPLYPRNLSRKRKDSHTPFSKFSTPGLPALSSLKENKFISEKKVEVKHSKKKKVAVVEKMPMPCPLPEDDEDD